MASVVFTQKDLDIYDGFVELRKIADSHIASALHGVEIGLRVPSPRTVELYSEIIAATEVHETAQRGEL